MHAPIIGITVDNRDNTAASGLYDSAIAYSRAVAAAGGVPVLLPHEPELASEYAATCDGLVLTGGGDPKMEPFGQPTHRLARVIDPRRQALDLALVDAAAQRDQPVLGVCLGMQLMGLRCGAQLNQYLPDTLGDEAAAIHEKNNRHGIVLRARPHGWPAPGDQRTQGAPDADAQVVSSHRQALSDAGSLRVVATAADGVIEAVDDPGRCFYVGVQWHPERGGAGPFNQQLFDRLVQACRQRRPAGAT